jgi:hypothetical protein
VLLPVLRGNVGLGECDSSAVLSSVGFQEKNAQYLSVPVLLSIWNEGASTALEARGESIVISGRSRGRFSSGGKYQPLHFWRLRGARWSALRRAERKPKTTLTFRDPTQFQPAAVADSAWQPSSAR